MSAPPSELRTERFVLRRWRADDADAFAAMNADPEVMADLGGPISRAASDAKLARFDGAFDTGGVGRWLIDGGGCVVRPGDMALPARLPGAYTAPDNVRSHAVMERLGLQRDASRDFTKRYDDVGEWRGLVWVARPA